jgi:hypothetical protein
LPELPKVSTNSNKTTTPMMIHNRWAFLFEKGELSLLLFSGGGLLFTRDSPISLMVSNDNV